MFLDDCDYVYEYKNLQHCLHYPLDFLRITTLQYPCWRAAQNSVMASQYLKNIANRRTTYALSKESPISDPRIYEILTGTIKHSPSSFNNQAGRAILLLGGHHDKLWNLAEDTVKTTLPQQAYDGLKPKLDGYKKGYGTVLFFEDSETLKPFKSAHPEMPFDQWSEHSQDKYISRR